ncbi:MAG TPA: phosphosulfolactate synthase [Candidatus Nanopelagicales bacterium]|jgi:phosphosulfolactate synthase|nr:phosphosulfolactate synthase [Candidatus Nanopelagicales bacterium]
MVNVAPDFLTLPDRAGKPRRAGITHVLDKGMPVAEAAAALGVCGPYVDVWKLGWGTAYLDPGLTPKLALLAEHGVLACTGGTLLEIAWHQGAVDPYLDWAAEVGFPCVEVSCGVVAMTGQERSALISQAAERFTVLSEVGLKDPSVAVSGQQWAQDAAASLAAGARWIVTEGRESGTVGLFDPDGQVREQVVDDVVGAVGADNVVFEAPRKDQQSWLIRRFGPDVNLGNIAPAEVLPLEALRLGLRADTFEPERRS